MEDPENLADFMAVTGYSPDALRAALNSTTFQRGLIDYFAGNEPLLLTLCERNNLRPESFMQVWARLNPSG